MSNKEPILKKHIKVTTIGKESNYEWPNHKTLVEAIYAAMDEYSAPFKKALQGMIQMYELDYPTTTHGAYREEYLFAVQVMKGEVIENDYYKQLAEACERMYNALVRGNFNDFAKYSEEWKKLKSSGSTDIKM